MSASKHDQDLQKRIQQLEAQRNSARIPLLFSNEGGRDWSVIVAPMFDDYGLDPYVMRCVHSLGSSSWDRWIQTWESISKMAHDCRMSDRQVKDCLALLTEVHLVKHPSGMTSNARKSNGETSHVNNSREILCTDSGAKARFRV